ncbi:Rossman fold protein, TIGR00730 family [Ewingella americana]|nr:Rossman fold protein, TIGR00730 family [Ewingella americana]
MAYKNNDLKAVCVYCGSSSGNDEIYVKQAEQLGKILAEAGLKLVFGGGTTGIMGALAYGSLNKGGDVAAIIPDFLTEFETTSEALQIFKDLTVIQTMHERKYLMFERSDAFVALPGGIGTLEEVVEIMTWAQLGRHNKPVVLLNTNGYWDHLILLLQHMQQQGFIHSSHLLNPIIVSDVAEIIPAIRSKLQSIGKS